MIRRAVGLFNSILPTAQWKITRRWFEYISTVDSGTAMLFMNYGYSEIAPGVDDLVLSPGDEEHRYCIQLYHHVVANTDLGSKDVLEIGCGRGGGADYIQRYLKPNRTVGVDLSRNAIEFCCQQYDVPGLSFQCGDAEDLNLPEASFDAVVSIESSVCFQNPERFFAEVERVLRPGGVFLYADLRRSEQYETWAAQLSQMGLDKISQTNITSNVLRALDLGNKRKQDLIKQYVPRVLQKIFSEFAGMKGTSFFYRAFETGEKEYRSYVFRKPFRGG